MSGWWTDNSRSFAVDFQGRNEAILSNYQLLSDPGDGSLIRAALNDIARARGMSQVARDAGIGRESLYKALGEQGNPEFVTIMKVIQALGFKLHATAA